jgi:A-macroglobulin complement component/MG2 domain-containing protein/alpha-2-macroglobulin family protein/carboxypeptidase family protein/macroglobulin-like protein/A-macroglobulin receptor
MVRRDIFSVFLSYFAAPLFFALALPASAQNLESRVLRVDEQHCSFRFSASGAATISLAVENPAESALPAKIRLELVDPRDVVLARADFQENLATGATRLALPFAYPAPDGSPDPQKATQQFFLTRLRYRIVPDPSTGGPAAAEGIIGIPQVLSDAFDLRLIAPGIVRTGVHCRITVIAVHPGGSRAVPGVILDAALTGEDAPELNLVQRKAVTDSHGMAVFDLLIPNKMTRETFTFHVAGVFWGLALSVEQNIFVARQGRIDLTTDKPLYRPGQTLHARVLAFDIGSRAIAAAPVTFTVYDPDRTLVHSVPATTSRFGIAAMDWPIPENERLGTYEIEARVGPEESGAVPGVTSVRVSRYELPAFAVAVHTDRAYYLVGQTATVQVRAQYLFGRPVGRGHVRVVREVERKWNYREQKWETEESEPVEGDTDASGLYTASLDLSAAFKELENDERNQYLDRRYAAYFTDQSTGRTEHRHFDVRATRHPIHIYVHGLRPWAPGSFPVELFIVTAYADGTPAPCRVTIRAESSQPDHKIARRPLSEIRTSRYGVARVQDFPLPRDFGGEDSLVFDANDSHGKTGTRREGGFYSPDQKWIRVFTDKALYAPGEPVEVTVRSGFSDSPLVLQAVRDWRVLASRQVHMIHGRAWVRFETDQDFQGRVEFIAIPLRYDSGESDTDFGSDRRAVLFPHPRELTLAIALSPPTVRPGEEAEADFRVRTAVGKSVQSALGLAVVDKAVAERARIDSDSEYSAPYGFHNEELQIAGITLANLEHLDMSKPVPEALDLVARILLLGQFGDEEMSSDSEIDEAALGTAFGPAISAALKPVAQAVQTHPGGQPLSPRQDIPLAELLSALGVPVPELLDPWGTPFHARLSVYRGVEQIEVTSAGPDKRYGTRDDFVGTTIDWPYFRETSEALERALQSYHERTGGYLRDAESTKRELLTQGVDFDALRDPWGRPYRLEFGISNFRYTVAIVSAGVDGRFRSEDEHSGDDFDASAASIDYFAETRARLSSALSLYSQSTGRAPENEAEFRDIARRAGVDWDALRDPWGHPYYVTMSEKIFFGDRYAISSVSSYGQSGKPRRQITPVTLHYRTVHVRSAGPDGLEGTEDDFEAASLIAILGEQSASDPTVRPEPNPVTQVGGLGSISGMVLDASGAAISGAEVTAKPESRKPGEIETSYQTATSEAGAFTLENLTTGVYSVRIESRGFNGATIVGVPVQAGIVSEVNATLEVGAATEVVEVQASVGPALQTLNATVGSVFLPGTTAAARSPLTTPRLREYFPETLLWQPELITDARGRAHMRFPLADTITTWKFSVTASTLDGQVVSAEKEIRAFQPFFVEHDPPRYLTAGDRISLPVVLRNYLDREQTVDWTVKPGPWFTLVGAGSGNARVPPNDSAHGVFTFTASSPVHDGKMRVTASNASVGDAIEKSVTVRPDGQEKVEAVGQVFRGSATLTTRIPDSAIPGTPRAELKIYPNLLAHVLESIEAILERPHGCAEQVISSAYPSLLYLRSARTANVPSSPQTALAEHYLALGYQRLLSHRASGGGFTYWGSGDPDVALSAYALRFLRDAKDLIAVDDAVIDETARWLLGRVEKDGSWLTPSLGQSPDPRRTAILTAYVTRVLSEQLMPEVPAGSKTADNMSNAERVRADVLRRVVNQALSYLAPAVQEMDEPYLLASYTLAAKNAGDHKAAAQTIARLRDLAQEEGTGSYWTLEANTPFNSWGLPGRVETTALVVETLASARSREDADSASRDSLLVSRGLQFLLRQQDRYGIWYSGQATVNVLRAMLSLLGSDAPASPDSARSASVLVNGKNEFEITLPPARAVASPIIRDLSAFIHTGENSVEVREQGGSEEISAQLLSDYYVPWDRGLDAGREAGARVTTSGALRLAVHYANTDAHTGDLIECTVEAERIGFRGYGMLLAEIGVPPGAEVDRESLDRAQQQSGWELNQYDVLPDRIILYLWPRAGGMKFAFDFRARYAIRAKSPSSILYDYYNPQAQVVLTPVQFRVD